MAAIPLSQRRWDLAFIGFFCVNLGFITYIVDVEQLIIADPNHFTYPIWPPHALVDLIHWWGRNFDPWLMARPPWWRATIWIDSLLFGPFYAVALYAFVKGKEWIRIPCFLWAATMMTNVTIILFEELAGTPHTQNVPVMLMANAAWFLMPIALIVRMARAPHPFSTVEER